MKFCFSVGDANGKPFLRQSSGRSRLCLAKPTGCWKMPEFCKNGVAGAEQHKKSPIVCKIYLHLQPIQEKRNSSFNWACKTAKKVPNFLKKSFEPSCWAHTQGLEGRRCCRQQKHSFVRNPPVNLLYPAHPEPGSSQAADGTFPANSTAPWKNACTACQGWDPIWAVRERRTQQIKTNCEQPAWEPGSSASSGGAGRTITARCSAKSPPGSQSITVPSRTDDQAELHSSYTKSIGNRFWLICCSLLMLGLWQLARLF